MGHAVYINKDMTELKKNKEIDIIGIINSVLKEPKKLIVFIAIFAMLGLFVALNKKKTYTSNVVLAPEIAGSSGVSQSISDMASNFGIDLGGKSGGIDAIYPDIYPDVLSSTDFVSNLFYIKVRTKENPNSLISYRAYCEQQKSGFSFKKMIKGILSLFIKKDTELGGNTKDPFWISKEDEAFCNAIRNSMTCLIDKKTNIITIGYTDNDPLVSAIMVDTIQHRLQEYITSYKTKKARNDVDYYQNLFASSKQDYVKARQLYANYADANEDIILESFKAKRDELENDMQLKYNIYTQVANQLQAARAKLQESTPAFVVVQSSKMPNEASSTPRMFVVLFFIFIGVVADVFWVVFLRNKIKKTINE